MSVARAQREIDAVEFSEWIAFRSIDPFPDDKFDLRFAHLCAVIGNTFHAKGRRPKPRDFLIEWDTGGRRRKQSSLEMSQRFALFARAHNQSLRGNRGNHRDAQR